jgi:NTP pyrophosphatase (non-canonical NTP hydrolase)
MNFEQFNDYQDQAAKTAVYPERFTILYTALGLSSEAGEVAGKVKKVLRDHNGKFSDEMRWNIADEVGDVMWYAALLCRDLNIPLDEVIRRNLVKLNSRLERGVLGGSGDNR